MAEWDEAAVKDSLVSALDNLGAFRESASPYVAEYALKALAPHLAARDAAVWTQACEAAAQLAFDTSADDPQPGAWNDACEHIAQAVRALTPSESAP